ncbi:clathrin assembly At1g25240 [Olea europaea subsp. europaea]|uniref:Clathrin assembly At1g25240 n=1 Tax=Olea europaea subsp. europaea TaxID=158383 RepID=A0A8S0SSN4_OLEEU|nr:clathrin assembly At1g25240 [Olea europaea subsp. europaea]
MRLWKRASGVLKDQNSIFLATLTKRSPLRNPDVEAAVIKATSHDEFSIDLKNSDGIYKWIRLSSSHLKPLVWSISNRMYRTRYWVVALKGLMLMHGVINCKASSVPKIGRLPFDLSNFKDGHDKPGKNWSHNAFVRAYYRFLDQKSIFVFQTYNGEGTGMRGRDAHHVFVIMHELVLLQKLQSLLDLLMQIKPLSKAAMVPLVLEAMDRIIVEIFDVYGNICRGIAMVLMNIYSSGKVEATMALKIVQKAMIQGDQLTSYFEFCHDIGVVNSSELPCIERVPEEGIQELQQIIKGFPEKSGDDGLLLNRQEENAIVVMDSRNDFKTIITDNWEKFDEESSTEVPKNPFMEASLTIPLPQQHHHQELPDLISFL